MFFLSYFEKFEFFKLFKTILYVISNPAYRNIKHSLSENHYFTLKNKELPKTRVLKP